MAFVNEADAHLPPIAPMDTESNDHHQGRVVLPHTIMEDDEDQPNLELLNELIWSSPPSPSNASPTQSTAPPFPPTQAILSSERVAVLRRHSSFARRQLSWGFDVESASSVDTKVSEASGNFYTRAVRQVENRPAARSMTFDSLPMEILRHICDSYLSIRYHLPLRLVNQQLNVLVMSNCCFWQRKVPNYKEVEGDQVKNCQLLLPRRFTVRDVSEMLVNEGAPFTSPLSSRPNSRVGSPIDQALIPVLPTPPLSRNPSLLGSNITYCFNGCAYQVWRSLAIEDKARKFRKSQRHELRAIAADTFASLLFPSSGSNAISFLLACCFFVLILTALSLMHYSSSSPPSVLAAPWWFALGVALPLGAMYMSESTLQRRILALLAFWSLVVSCILAFVFRTEVSTTRLPWSVCILPFFIVAVLSAVLESGSLISRSRVIDSRLVVAKDCFVNQKKRHVPIPPRQFLWLNTYTSIATMVFMVVGLLFFMMENDGLLSVATANFTVPTNYSSMVPLMNMSNYTIATNQPQESDGVAGQWISLPVYYCGLFWMTGWLVALVKVGCVVLAYYSKHLRKYVDCSFIVGGHGVVFFVLVILSIILVVPGSYFEMQSPIPGDELTMITVIRLSPGRRLVLFGASVTVILLYFVVNCVNTLSGKEKYYKTSLRTKYLPYFDAAPSAS